MPGQSLKLFPLQSPLLNTGHKYLSCPNQRTSAIMVCRHYVKSNDSHMRRGPYPSPSSAPHHTNTCRWPFRADRATTRQRREVPLSSSWSHPCPEGAGNRTHQKVFATKSWAKWICGAAADQHPDLESELWASRRGKMDLAGICGSIPDVLTAPMLFQGDCKRWGHDNVSMILERMVD